MRSFRYGFLCLCSMMVSALLILTPKGAYAQKEWNVWYFGNYAGVDFNTGAPVALSNSEMHQDEGCAVVCDRATGRLLFYTDGDTVWNAQHRIMGSGLYGHTSSTQSAVIVPMPGDSTRYYIFTTSAGEYRPDGALPHLGCNYSIVDMKLNGGLGGVVVKNINLLPNVAEKLVGVRHANGRDYWVITHGWKENAFYSYRVSRRGVEPPVVSTVGGTYLGDEWNRIGTIKVSPNGKKLVAVTYYMDLVQLFDFDNRTGIIANPLQLPSNTWEYGACFSSDNSKLYVAQSRKGGSTIYQYDVSSSSPIAILASRTAVGSFPLELGDIQLAADKKIYLAQWDSDWLGVIDFPDRGGMACNYRSQGVFVDILPYRDRYSRLGLPNVINSDLSAIDSSVVPPEAHVASSRTSICAGETVDFRDASLVNPTNWEWSFPGATPASSTARNPSGIRYNTPGAYVATLVASSPNGDDTARVMITVHPLPIAVAEGDNGKNVQICLGGSAQLRARGGMSYRWSPATGLSCTDCASPVATPTTTTTYTMVATNEFGCPAVDQVTVVVNTPPKAVAGPDQTTCPGISVGLEASGGVSYSWSPRVGLDCYNCPTPSATPMTTTTYKVVVTNAAGCSDSDEVTVTVVSNSTADAGPDRTICPEGQTTLTVSAGTGYAWTPATGLSCTDCRSPIAAPDSTTTYHVAVTTPNGCLAIDSVTVYVRPRPSIVVGPRATICRGDSLRLTASGGVSYSWAPATGLSCVDCASPVARPEASVTYLVTVVDANGCVGRDTITVSVDPAPRIVNAHIERTYGVYPGTSLDVPVILDDPLDLAYIDELVFTLRYDPGMLRLANGGTDDTIRSMLRKTLLGGWSLTVLDSGDGSYKARLTAPPGRYLEGTGKLLLLSFRSFLGGSILSELPFQIDLMSSRCTRVETSPGLVRIDSVCGLNLRLITGGLGEYALEQNRPNPFNPTTEIRFSLGLDGPTRLVVHDAVGREVAVLVNEVLQPGDYVVTWDATEFPSGLYYYRLTSGVWSRTNMMILRK